MNQAELTKIYKELRKNSPNKNVLFSDFSTAIGFQETNAFTTAYDGKITIHLGKVDGRNCFISGNWADSNDASTEIVNDDYWMGEIDNKE